MLKDCREDFQGIQGRYSRHNYGSCPHRRIGKTKQYKGRQYGQIIVRFTSWQHCIAVYRSKKESKKYKVWLNFTKRRLKFLNEANELLEAKGKSGDCFAFADANCRLCVKLDGDFHYFGNLNELKTLYRQS